MRATSFPWPLLAALSWSPLAKAQVAPTTLDGGTPQPPPAPEELGSLTLAATGDIMMHEAVKQAAAANGFAALFAQVTRALQAADVAFGNLETPVAPNANRGTKAFLFNAPINLLPALKAAGFGIVSFANNHAYDQGSTGLVETIANLTAAALPELGAGRTRAEALTPVIVERHGVKVGFLGCTARFNNNLNSTDPKKPFVVPADAEVVAPAVAALAKTVDAVVVSVHWGNEYESEPAPEQVAFAQKLVEAGALVVLGSHPHVLQRIELFPAPDGRVALVAFSLGNFISNQSRDFVEDLTPAAAADPRDGALLQLTLRKRRYAGGQVRTEVTNAEALPLWTDNNALPRKRQPKLPPDIHVVDLRRELRDDRDALLPLAAPGAALDERQRHRALELQQRIELLSQQLVRISERLGGGYVAPGL